MKTLKSIVITSMIRTLVLSLILNLNECSSYESNITSFLQCLPQQSNTSNPITEATYTPKHASFSLILQQHIRNLRFNTSTTPKPLAIVTAMHKLHVQATVICAKKHGLEMRIRSGGHDYEGLSYVSSNPYVILDMFNLRAIDIDQASETSWVQSGATLGELYYVLARMSSTLAFPGGVCPTVGVGGHFSGGGYGFMLRKFGLTIDHIIDAEVVDANGKILRRNSMGEDLFWAIRGGGAASFCVVLSWKIKLVHVPSSIVTIFQIDRTLEQNGSEILYEWQNFGPKTDPNLFLRTNCKAIRSNLGGYKTVNVSFIGSYLGNASALVELMNKEFPILGLNQNDTKETTWVLANLFLYGFPNAAIESLLLKDPLLPLVYEKHKSDYVQNPIPKLGLEAFFKKLIEVENVEVQFNPYGGMMGQIAEDATPFPHRKGHLFKIQYLANWNESSQDVIDQNVQHVREVYDVMTPYVSKNPREAFLNYRDIDIGTHANKTFDFAWDFFKGNFNRLIQVKSKVDPNNFFRNEQSIPVVIIGKK